MIPYFYNISYLSSFHAFIISIYYQWEEQDVSKTSHRSLIHLEEMRIIYNFNYYYIEEVIKGIIINIIIIKIIIIMSIIMIMIIMKIAMNEMRIMWIE